MAKATLPNLSETELAELTQPEAERLKQQVEAWAAAETKPMHDRMAAIDAEIAALHVEKREMHTQIEEIERQSAERRYELRGPEAGPDQELLVGGALSDAEIEKLRRVVEQHDRRHTS